MLIIISLRGDRHV